MLCVCVWSVCVRGGVTEIVKMRLQVVSGRVGVQASARVSWCYNADIHGKQFVTHCGQHFRVFGERWRLAMRVTSIHRE